MTIRPIVTLCWKCFRRWTKNILRIFIFQLIFHWVFLFAFRLIWRSVKWSEMDLIEIKWNNSYENLFLSVYKMEIELMSSFIVCIDILIHQYAKTTNLPHNAKTNYKIANRANRAIHISYCYALHSNDEATGIWARFMLLLLLFYHYSIIPTIYASPDLYASILIHSLEIYTTKRLSLKIII